MTASWFAIACGTGLLWTLLATVLAVIAGRIVHLRDVMEGPTPAAGQRHLHTIPSP